MGFVMLTSCSDGPEAPGQTPQATIAPGPNNVLSAAITLSQPGTDSAVVRFGVAGSRLDSVTPATVVSTDPAVLPVLGLLPVTPYRFQVVAFGKRGRTVSDTLSLTTGSLPADLPAYSAGGPDPSPGYVVFASYPYGLVIDNSGRVVWYRHIDAGPTLNFQVEPTGRYATSPIVPIAGDPAPWVEYDPLGDEIHRVGCADGLGSRFHDLIAKTGRVLLADVRRCTRDEPHASTVARPTHS